MELCMEKDNINIKMESYIKVLSIKVKNGENALLNILREVKYKNMKAKSMKTNTMVSGRFTTQTE
jgi:hypothetical protein